MGHYACKSEGIGLPPSSRAIEAGWPLAAGEFLVVADSLDGRVVDDDGVSLRVATVEEQNAGAEADRIAAITAAASAHIAQVIPEKGRDSLYAYLLHTINRKASGAELTQAEVDMLADAEAKFTWVLTVHGERDQAIAANTPAADVTFTPWQG